MPGISTLLSTYKQGVRDRVLSHNPLSRKNKEFAGLSPDEILKERYCISNRELEVIHLLLEGNTRKQIAATLFISENTARTHAKNIYQKLEIHSLADLADFVDKLRS